MVPLSPWLGRPKGSITRASPSSSAWRHLAGLWWAARSPVATSYGQRGALRRPLGEARRRRRTRKQRLKRCRPRSYELGMSAIGSSLAIPHTGCTSTVSRGSADLNTPATAGGALGPGSRRSLGTLAALRRLRWGRFLGWLTGVSRPHLLHRRRMRFPCGNDHDPSQPVLQDPDPRPVVLLDHALGEHLPGGALRDGAPRG